MSLKTVVSLGVASLVLATAVPAFAQQYPDVASLEEFSAEAGYMSLPGYLRWVVFQQTNQWISYAEAERIVDEQRRRAANLIQGPRADREAGGSPPSASRIYRSSPAAPMTIR